MRLSLSNLIVVASLATLLAGCSQSDPNPGGSAGSGGQSSAGSPSSAGAGIAGSGIAGSSGSSAAGSSGSGAGGTSGSGTAGTGGSPGTSGSGGGNTAGASGNPGTAGSTSSVPPTFAGAVKPVVAGGGQYASCDAAPCHGKGGAAPPPPSMALVLPANDDQLLYTNLTTYISKGCGNIPLVKKGDGEGSALVKALRGTCPAPTERMPQSCNPDPNSGNCIPDEYIAAISQWITNGAPQQ